MGNQSRWSRADPESAEATDSLRDARKVYTDEDLIYAITGLDHSPFHRGENDNGVPYVGWRYLLGKRAHCSKEKSRKDGGLKAWITLGK